MLWKLQQMLSFQCLFVYMWLGLSSVFSLLTWKNMWQIILQHLLFSFHWYEFNWQKVDLVFKLMLNSVPVWFLILRVQVLNFSSFKFAIFLMQNVDLHWLIYMYIRSPSSLSLCLNDEMGLLGKTLLYRIWIFHKARYGSKNPESLEELIIVF